VTLPDPSASDFLRLLERAAPVGLSTPPPRHQATPSFEGASMRVLFVRACCNTRVRL
jgi:hypothetical protein